MDPITLSIIGAAGAGANVVGDVVGANSSAQAQASANETNLQLAEMGEAFGASQVSQQEQFQEMMSSTAVERHVADEKAAGINPMIDAGGMASSPSGAAANPVVPTVQPVNSGAGLARGFSAAGAGALQLASNLKDFEAKDAQIAASKAQALSSVASASNSQASAAATQASMPSIAARARSALSESDANIAESQSRAAKARWDKSAAGYDAVSSRVLQALGAASNAYSMGRLIKALTPSSQAGRSSGADNINIPPSQMELDVAGNHGVQLDSSGAAR